MLPLLSQEFVAPGAGPTPVIFCFLPSTVVWVFSSRDTAVPSFAEG